MNVGVNDLRTINVEVARHIVRRHGRTGAFQGHSVQLSMHQDAAMPEILERQK